MNIDDIIDEHNDPQKRANAIKQTQDDYVANGGALRTVQQAVNDTLGMRAQESREDNDNTQSDSILTTLYLANEWLAASMARRWGNNEDVNAAAHVGLWVACTRFKPGKGSFIGYASRYIHYEIAKAAAAVGYESFYEWRSTPAIKTAVDDLALTGRPASIENIAALTGLSTAVISRVLNPLTPLLGSVKVHEKDDSITLIDTIPSTELTYDPQTVLLQTAITDTIADALTTLTPMQREVITRHYGLGGQPPVHLTVIVADTGWSKETVSRAHKQALETLSSRLSPACLP